MKTDSDKIYDKIKTSNFYQMFGERDQNSPKAAG